MTSQESVFNVASFPMGPRIKNWLEISDDTYRGHENTSPTAHDAAAFTDFVLTKIEDSTPTDADHLVDLLEELVGMNMPLLAVKLADAYPHLFPQSDFRAQLHVGNASMLIGDLARAELAFIDAQKLVPEEPAPYINLAQIYCHDNALDRAREWCLAGLDTDQDNTRLWELLAWLEQNNGTSDAASAAGKIAVLAKEKNSWAGMSLACDLVNPEDALTKLAALETFWDEGCRAPEFLIEFTAVLGMAGRYDRIPSIIWQAEKQAPQGLPWQLTLHLAQAYLGLGRDQDALATLDKLSNSNELPDFARQAAEAIKAEATGQSTAH